MLQTSKIHHQAGWWFQNSKLNCQPNSWFKETHIEDFNTLLKLMFRYMPQYIDGLVQERCNSSALAMELRLSCANPSIYAKQKSTLNSINCFMSLEQGIKMTCHLSQMCNTLTCKGVSIGLMLSKMKTHRICPAMIASQFCHNFILIILSSGSYSWWVDISVAKCKTVVTPVLISAFLIHWWVT